MAKTSHRSNHGPRKEANTFYQATGSQAEREEASEKRGVLQPTDPKFAIDVAKTGITRADAQMSLVLRK